MARDAGSVVRLNAEIAARNKNRAEAASRLLGRDAAALVLPDLTLARGDYTVTAEALFHAGERVRGVLSDVSARVAFARALTERAALAESDLFPVFEGDRPIRVLYARAGAADRAYRLFASVLSDPRVGYADTNPDAAEGAEIGVADLVLLPYADAAGNPVLSTQELAETHGLLLSGLARVKVGDGLYYGLFGRAVYARASTRVTLHLAIPSPDVGTLAEIFCLARDAGLSPDGVAVSSAGRRATFALTGERTDCLVAAVFCLAFFPGCELRGWRPAQPQSER